MKQRKKEEYLRQVLEIPVDSLRPNPGQPRKTFDTEGLVRLAKSISREGIIQPLSVRARSDGFELIAGERRLRAAKMAGLRTVPCIVFEANERGSAIMALIENIERSDLGFFEEAEAINNLVQVYGMTQGDAALRLGMAQSTVANKLRLLKLPEDERKLITTLGLTERHARTLLQLENKRDRLEVLQKVAGEGLNVEKTDKLVKETLKADKKRRSYARRAPLLGDVRLFINTVNKAMEVMRLSGVEATSTKKKKGNIIEYTITIPIV